MSILIKSGYVIDPKNNIDGVLDILLKDGKVAKLDKSINADQSTTSTTIDAKGLLVFPGLIDMHTHLRQPGREDEETFFTGSMAAAKGGFTCICAMPNTKPVCDNSGMVEYILSEARKSAVINILPIGAITVGQKGEDIAEISDMRRAGIVAISDDGFSVRNSHLMRKALEYSRMFDIPVISHCEDIDLSLGGVMNEGFYSTLLGLKGIPNTAEASMVVRDIMLAELTGARLHIAHISTKQSLHFIQDAKQQNIKVTCETCPHYFTLCDEEIKGFNTNLKVNPPLRSRKDIEAIKEGLRDGIIDVIATDHAPHTEVEKDVEFDLASSGMIGLETALFLSIKELVEKDILSWSELVKRLSMKPAEILNLKTKGSLSLGNDADLSVVDPHAEWVYKKEDILSKSKNSPFIGAMLKGKVIYTICAGKVVYKNV